MPQRHPFTDTCEQMLRDQLPNLFRLYLNPFVTQACFCLGRYVQSTWDHGRESRDYQTFLANGFDEALSGAIKLARYDANVAGRPTPGLMIDPVGRFGPFAATTAAGGARVEFLPGLTSVRGRDDLEKVVASNVRFGFVALVATEDDQGLLGAALEELLRPDGALLITCMDRGSLAAVRSNRNSSLRKLTPDVVVFDESFAHHDVPFGAFTARRTLYDHWNRPGKTTFHSTTYQPNTISSLHFIRCLERDDPEFFAAVAADVRRILVDLKFRGTLFRRLYSPTLYKAMRMTGCVTADMRAAGEFVYVSGRRIFDGVSGVACSIRGHNPSHYVDELATQGELAAVEDELTTRLRQLTGLDGVLPAVSGATAIENALKIALATQYPKRHVLALKSGFGGKTLLALTGTWNASYKEHIDPLYADVVYVDPFAADAITQIDAVLERHPVAVVQLELIQGVGGVRQVPEAVVRHLEQRRQRHGYLLLVDEVQTGMYRTGPFVRSRALGIAPDLLVVGKGVSDMMFPFALLMCSTAVMERLERTESKLADAIRQRYGYEFGYRTALNVLRQAEEMELDKRVSESGALISRLLAEGLSQCKAVREVRVFGQLIGIELDASRWPRRRFRKRLFWFYLFNMLRHPRFPVLVGFCQYEPNVLKITPPLTAGPDELRRMCATIVEVLKRPFYRLAARVVGGMVGSVGIWRQRHEHVSVTADEPGTR